MKIGEGLGSLKSYRISEARKNLTEIMDCVIGGGERICILWHKFHAVAVSVEDFNRLQKSYDLGMNSNIVTYGSSDARQNFSELIRRVCLDNECIGICLHEKISLVLIPLGRLQHFEPVSDNKDEDKIEKLIKELEIKAAKLTKALELLRSIKKSGLNLSETLEIIKELENFV